MGKFQDLTGQRFGRLTVIKRAEDHVSPRGQHHAQWLCHCDCGTETIVMGKELKNENTKSCGCYRKERVKEYSKKYNDWFIDMNTTVAVGTDSKGNKFTIDAEDWLKVKDYCWWVDVHGYPKARINGRKILLHRFLLNCPDDMLADHRNGERANCCKSNLRICTYQQNAMNRKKQNNNSSGCAGVYWHKGSNKWAASIQYKGKRIHLGKFSDIEDAIKARQEAEVKYFAEYRRVGVLNE